MSGEAIAIVGAAVGLLGVLVPLLLSIRKEVTEVRRDLHAEATAIRADLHALAERVARIEGAMTGPWRPPANGNPAPTPTVAPSPEAPP